MDEIHWSVQAGYPLLATLQLLPLLAAVVTWVLRDARPVVVVPLAFGFAGLELLLAIDLYRRFDISAPAMQLAERVDLLGPVVYHAAADGITVVFMLLTAIIALMAVIYRPVGEPAASRSRYLGLVFALEAVVQGLFASVNLLWFSLLAALELVLVAYLMWHWASSAERELALSRFLQFTGTGLALLIGGMVMLGWAHADAHAGRWSFDQADLTDLDLAAPFQAAVFFLLFYGIGIRIPIFPLHGWLPRVAEHGTVAVVPVFLLGLKIGIYGLLRFVLPVLPGAVVQWHGWVVVFAVAGIFYAALLAMMQRNLRRLLAFAVVSHTSILIIGLFSLHQASFEGAVILSVDFGLAIAGLFFMTAVIYRRTRTASLDKLGGLFDRIPLIGIAFLVAGLSIIGMPGTPGFDAAHLMLESTIDRFGATVTIAAALGNVAAAGFLLWAFQRVFLAPPRAGAGLAQMDAPSLSENALGIIVVVVLLGAGFYTQPWLELTETAAAHLAGLYGPVAHR